MGAIVTGHTGKLVWMTSVIGSCGGLCVAIINPVTFMNQTKQRWKFNLFPQGSPKQISKQGLWIAIISSFASVCVNYLSTIIAIPEISVFLSVIMIDVLAVVICYGLILIIFAGIKSIVLKLKHNSDVEDMELISPSFKKRWTIIFIIVVSLGLGYYLFIRPSIIRATCNQQAGEFIKGRAKAGSYDDMNDVTKSYDFAYAVCVRKSGMNP